MGFRAAIRLVIGGLAPSAVAAAAVWSFGGEGGRDGWAGYDESGAAPRCRLVEDTGHDEKGALYAESSKSRRAWVCASTPVNASVGYVLEGWVKIVEGEGWLDVSYRDAGGAMLKTWKTPRVRASRDWTYVAVDVPPMESVDNGGCTAEIAFGVRGAAYVDDVAFLPNAALTIINGDFQMPLDKKGRVSYWNEDSNASLHKGSAGGAFGLAVDSNADGASALELKASADWFAFTSINYPVDAGVKTIAASARAETEAGAAVRLGLVWTDSDQSTVRVDWGRPTESTRWTDLRTRPVKVPASAQSVRPIVLVAKSSGDAGDPSARVDDVRLSMSRSRTIQVTVNQVGYETDGPKSAIVQTNYFPTRSAEGLVQVLDASDRVVLEQPLDGDGRMRGQQGADWGWYFWRADFSRLKSEGEFRVRARVGKEESVSPAFRIGRHRLFEETVDANVEFFYVQRCGFEVPGWHAACHLDCAKLPDGTHRELNGGWHSAGDYNKLTWEYGDGGVMYALVSAYEAAPDHFVGRDRDGDGVCDILDEAWWGARFVAKVQVPDSGGLLNHIEQGPDRATWMKWCPPEKTTDNVVGTADDPVVIQGNGNSPLAIGAWARLSRLLDAKAIPNDYRERASRLWAHATAGGTGGADPLLLISSLDLFDVTGDDALLQYVRRSVEGLLAGNNGEGMLPGGYSNSGDIPAAALAYFAVTRPDDPLTPRIRERLVRHTDGFLAEARNPLGLMMQQRGADGYFFEPSSTLGCNYMGNCRAWSAVMVYRVTRDSRLLAYAMDQLDFLLGRNLYGICMMEGEGSVNLPRYHHRYVTIPGHEDGAVPGAIPNGFVRDLGGNDRPGVDLSTGGRQYPSYRTNEPWLVHNVFYTLALTALHEAVSQANGV